MTKRQGFEVMAERCKECLYGPDKIVSNARRAQIIREITQKDCHFICHKATIAGRDVCCRGDFDQHGGGKVGRFANWLGVVKFIPESELGGVGEYATTGEEK